MPDARVLYDTDFYGWTREQSALLRAKAELLPNDAVDWAHVAEEIEDMGKALASSIRSSYARIIEHLLKLEHARDPAPRRGWVDSVIEHRGRIPEVLSDAPSLRPRLDQLFADAWDHGRRQAAKSLQHWEKLDEATLPTHCPYTRAQVEDFDWFPANRHGHD